MGDPRCDLLHELLNSLTVVLGECDLLQDEACQQASLRLSIIREQAHYMAELIREHRCPVPRHQPRPEGFIRSLIRAAVGR